MPLPSTKVMLAAATAGSGGYSLTPQETGDFDFGLTAYPGASWITTLGDLNGDGVAEIVTGVPGNSDKSLGGGRIYINFGSATGGTSTALGDNTSSIRIDGALVDDHAGVAVAAISDLNGDGLSEILVGAPLADPAGASAAGRVYVVWTGAAAASIDLNDVNSAGSGEGFVISGEAAGDHAGEALGAIADLNGDGRAEILIGAPGSDAGGADAGAAYVVWGRATDTPVTLASVTTGTRGFRIVGETAGDAAGSAIVAVGDLNGDGRADMLVGAPGNDAAGIEAGAAYVVFGKGTGTAVSLADVALGTGGYRITGAADGQQAGARLAALGDVNADGRADMLLGAADGVYVVYGKGDTAEVSLVDVAAGLGGFMIVPEAGTDLAGLTVTGGGDLNRDGIADIVIGTPQDAEGGFQAGATYVVWGGSHGSIDLGLVAIGAGGAKVVGAAGSFTGSSVAIAPDINGDGAADLVIGSPGGANPAVSILYAPASWQPDDNVYGTNGADMLGAGAGGRHVIGEGADSVYSFDGADSISSGGGADQLDGGAGADTLVGGAGDDVYEVDGAGDVVIEEAGEGSDTVRSAASVVLADNVEALVLTSVGRTGTGNGLANLLMGSVGGDTLLGLAGADTLLGDGGADSLDGGAAADSMVGGAGNDRYVIDDAGDTVVEGALGGTDTVSSSVDYVIGADVEVLVLTGAAHAGSGHAGANTLVGGDGADSLAGLGGADSLVGGAAADTLDGGTGTDTMAGGGGDDLFIVDALADRVVELALGGLDTVVASVDHTLASEIEALVLSAAGHRGTGNAGANRLFGSDGTDTLDGALGADTMDGGAGDDVYIVGQAGDVVVEGTFGGHDTVQAAVSWTLAAEVEELVLTVAGLTGTGNALGNAITGSAGADTLDGAAGADTMAGGAGDDLYRVDDVADVVVDSAGADTVIATADHALGDGVETLLLNGLAHHGTGNALANLLRGGGGDDLLEGGLGADTLEGAAGADTMAGGAGDDVYLITDPGDVVIELAGEGLDTVIVSTDWTLATGIEGVQLLGTGHALTGNAEANTISGNAGDDTLDGDLGDDLELGGDGDDVLISGAGHDTLSGGSGDDRFEIHGGSVHIEDFLGHDTLDASDAIGDCSIDLSGTDASIIDGQYCDLGQGGSAAGPLDLQFLQDLTGSFADDIAMVRGLVPQIVVALQGVQPDSTFGVSSFRDKAYGSFGGTGDWVYRQEAALSQTTAALTTAYTSMVASNGADGPEAQIEALMQLALHTTDIGFRTNSARFVVLFTDAPFHVAGDGIAAGIPIANNGDAIMDGTPAGTGEDYPAIAQLRAALEAANIIPIFAVAGGNDAAYQGLLAQLGRGAEVTLTANSSNVVAAITAGLTVATRTSIEDAMGGGGDDTIHGNATDNRVDGGAGMDVLFGADGRDTLTGGLGDDRLDGGAGVDSLAGGGGNDAYIVTDAGDVVSEAAGQGHDTISAERDWALGANFEDLVLSGTALRGSGNSLANLIVGTAAGNALSGGAGNDTLVGDAGNDALNGGVGADSLVGGIGNDTYTVDNLLDVVVEAAGGGTDTVRTTLASYSLGANIENLAFIGTGPFTGIGTATANAMTGGAGNDTLAGDAGNDALNGGAGADSLAGGAGNDTYTVDNVLDVVVEAAGGGTDTVRTTLASYSLGVNIENLAFIGSGSFFGTGTAVANAMTGGAGNDTLVGGLGVDSLTGGLGSDAFRFDDVAQCGDSISDYTVADDIVLVSATGFGGGLTSGIDLLVNGQYVENVTGLANAPAGLGQFVFEVDASRLWWDGDGVGGVNGIIVANLTGITAFSSGEIAVIA